jgi:uncharacterized protein YbjQ (UPF0145 family)
MIVTTTPRVEGRPVTDYLGVVTGEAIIGANILKDLFAAVRDVVGGHAGAYEDPLKRAREEALREMIREAEARGADAILGMDLDYEVLGVKNGMLMVTCAGTAARLSSSDSQGD